MENKPKYTPGPWKFGGFLKRTNDRIIIGGESDTVVAFAADMNEYKKDAEVDANAALIAAAPELLAVMKDAQGLLDNASAELRKRYRAAISKAEGKS